MEDIVKQKYFLITISLILSLLIIVFGIIIANNMISNERNDIYLTNNLIIDIQPNIKRKLDVINNYDIKNIKSNRIIITNNTDKTISYKIVMSPINNKENRLKVSLNDTYIRELSNIKKENNYYILYEGSIYSRYTNIFNLKLWLIDNQYINNKFNYKLKVIES